MCGESTIWGTQRYVEAGTAADLASVVVSCARLYALRFLPVHHVSGDDPDLPALQNQLRNARVLIRYRASLLSCPVNHGACQGARVELVMPHTPSPDPSGGYR